MEAGSGQIKRGEGSVFFMLAFELAPNRGVVCPCFQMCSILSLSDGWSQRIIFYDLDSVTPVVHSIRSTREFRIQFSYAQFFLDRKKFD